MQAAQDSPIIKHRRRKFSTAHARRRARAYSNAIKRELPVEQSTDELRSSHESSLANGSAAFLKGLLCETDGHAKGITERYETQREVSQKYINNSLHLARKYARIFVRGHYLFREANSFPRAKLEENCELRVISVHIFEDKWRLLCLLVHSRAQSCARDLLICQQIL